ncbi:MAG: AAA family ATPase [Peptococcaceae bacterium]|nr:AAA family ATPase [Peptococcaceae bacterium]
MKIKQLNLLAFGPFSDYEINLDGRCGFNLIYGLNEAGKTTLLRAIRDFLYGMPERCPDAHLHPTHKLRIQALLETKDGAQLVLTRRKGRKNTLLDQDGQPVDENILGSLLGAIDRESFGLMFGMDHHSLRKGGTDLLQGQGALGEALFAAASGIGGLRELLGELDREAGDLFKPSGSRPLINQDMAYYNELRKTISQSSLAPRKWQALEKDYQEQKAQMETLKKEEGGLGQNLARLERLAKTLPLVARRQEYLENMQLLGDVPVLPPNFKEKVSREMGTRDREQEAVKKARIDRENMVKEKETLVIPPGLLEHAERIKALQQSLGTYRDYRQEIPTVEGEISELQQETLALLRRLEPACTKVEEAEKLRLPQALMEEIKLLGADHPLLEKEYSNAQSQAQQAWRSLEKLAEEKRGIGELRDAGGLKRVLASARKPGSLEEHLRKARSQVKALEERLTNQLQALGHWAGTLEQLEQLPLPLEETVRVFEERFKDIKDRLQKLKDKLAEGKNSLKNGQKELQELELTGEVPTEEHLKVARTHRQVGWQLVRRAWLEGQRDPVQEQAFHAEKPLAEAYEASVIQADDLADAMRREAQRVERKKFLGQEIWDRKVEITALLEKQAKFEGEYQALEQEWHGVWENAGITPLTPAEMLSWLGRCGKIIAGLEQLNEQRRNANDLVQQIGKHREQVGRELQNLGETGDGEEESLEELLERAQEVWEEYQNQANRLQTVKKMYKRAEESLVEAQNQKSEAKTALEQWKGKWTRALSQAGLPPGISCKAALEHLNLLEQVLSKKEERDSRQVVHDKMKNYVEGFEKKLKDLLVKLAPDLLDLGVEDGAVQLQERVVNAQRDLDRRESLVKQIGKIDKTDQQSTERAKEAGEELEALMAVAGCTEESQLPQVMEKAARLAELGKKAAGLEEHLLSLGSGLSLKEIIAETSGVNGDSLPGELAEVQKQLAANRQKQDELNQIFGVTKKEYMDKIEGASTTAADAAEEAQGVLARMRGRTEEYLRLRLGAIVLRRSIERYREENQSPVIRAAGELFALLTGSAFVDLKVDFDQRDNPVLLGLRSTGEEVTVEAMSDGTLDQLFLSLRLASLGRYLAKNEPLPFILDDLLVNFDDVRAAETMKVLGEFARKTQVLFFTHHLSLVELAERVIPQVNKVILQ